MKILSITLLVFVPLATFSQGQPLNRPPMREVPTNEELVLKLRKSDQDMADAAAAARALSDTTDPRVPQKPDDLINESEILCYNGLLTLVPKSAVLQFPANLKERLKPQPGARVVSWSEFYTANLGWITTVEVSMVQAMGREALSDETSTHITKCGKLVVATYHGHPVSVHPVPVPEKASATAPNPGKP